MDIHIKDISSLEISSHLGEYRSAGPLQCRVIIFLLGKEKISHVKQS